MTRVLVYAKGFPPGETGGPVEVAFRLVRELVRCPCVHVTLIAQTDSTDAEIRDAVGPGAIEVLRLPYFPSPRELLALRPVVAAFRKADVVHFNEFPFRHLPLVLLAKVRGVPTVFSMHGLMSREIRTFLGPAYGLTFLGCRESMRIPRPAIRALLSAYRWTSKAWTAVVAPSEALKRFAVSSEGFASSKISVIPHGIDLPDGGTPVAGPTDRPRILFVGKLEAVKGPDLLLDALERLSEAGVCVDVTFVGAGSLEAALRRRAASLAGHRITFAGACRGRDLQELYASTDIVAIPSRWESLSLVALEAMAAGRPIVATRVGGIPEVLRDPWNALLVPPDAASLAAGLRRLIAEPSTREAMRSANLAEARRRPWSSVAARYLELYSRLLDGTPQGTRE